MRHYELLLEYNILNISKKFDNHESLDDYLKQQSSYFYDLNIKKWYESTLKKFLINDEESVIPVQKLPNNAPSWAIQASQTSQLYYFSPNLQRSEEIEHIGHWLSALLNDINNPFEVENNDQRSAILQRKQEAETIIRSLPIIIFDVAVQKSNQYFSRGKADNTAFQEKDFEIVAQLSGWKWVVLCNEEAYKLAGKVLQNCIGDFYHFNPIQPNKMIILLDPQNKGHIATRIRTDTLLEMKGKNNKPPLEKFLPFIRNLIITLGLTKDSSNDLEKMGVSIYNGKLLTIDEIIKEVNPEEVLSFGNHSVFKISNLTTFVGRVILKVNLPSFYDTMPDTGWIIKEKDTMILSFSSTGKNLFYESVLKSHQKIDNTEIASIMNILIEDQIINLPENLCKFWNKENGSNPILDTDLMSYEGKFSILKEVINRVFSNFKIIYQDKYISVNQIILPGILFTRLVTMIPASVLPITIQYSQIKNSNKKILFELISNDKDIIKLGLPAKVADLPTPAIISILNGLIDKGIFTVENGVVGQNRIVSSYGRFRPIRN